MTEEYSADDIEVIDLVGMNFKELILQVEKWPSLLPERTILHLDAFLHGWLIGRGYDADNGVMQRFSEYVSKNHDVKTNHGWARIINHYSLDSYEALDNFFKLFHQFLETEQ